MKVAFFDVHDFEKPLFEKYSKQFTFECHFFDFKLNSKTISLLPFGFDGICSFVNDQLNEEQLRILSEKGIQFITLRSAGFNHVHLPSANKYKIHVARVPGYSPNAISEFTLGLILSLNRKIHKSYARVRDLNFSLNGLIGFDLNQKTVGIIGTGKIGRLLAKSLNALGCKVLAFDKEKSAEISSFVEYTSLERLFAESDLITLHVPLTTETYHMINEKSIAQMKEGVYLINTGRGKLIDTPSLIQGLKQKKIAGVALDVYEEEENIFFQDHSESGLDDDILSRLLTFPNVLITSHQAFLTQEALENIAKTTFENIAEFQQFHYLKKNALTSF